MKLYLIKVAKSDVCIRPFFCKSGHPLALILCFVTGYGSIPTNRGFNAYQHSEFATVAGGNYKGMPSTRNEPNFYLRERFDQQQGHTDQRQYHPGYNHVQQQSLVRDGAQQRAPPTNQGGAQEAKRSNQQCKPVIKSKQELGRYNY